MKLTDAAKQYEKCMYYAGPCLVKDCPLHKSMTLEIGNPSDECGRIVWEIGGCSLMGRLEEFLRDKKAGTPINFEEVRDGSGESSSSG